MLQQHFIALMVTCVTTTCVAIFVYLKGRDRLTNITYAIYTGFIALWSGSQAFSMTIENYDLALWLWRLNHVGVIFIPPFFVHFVISLLPEGERAGRKKLIKLSYLVSLIFFVLNIAGFLIPEITQKHYFRYYFDPTPIYTVFFVSWVFLAGYGLVQLFVIYLKAPPSEKNKFSYFSISMLLAYIGGTPNFFPVFDIVIPYLSPLGSFLIPVYMACTAYAIIAHHLMDIKVLIRRTLLYSFFVAVISAFYMTIVFAIHKLILGEVNPGVGFLQTFSLYAVPPLIGMAFFLVLTLLTFLSKPRTPQKLIFACLCFATFYWQTIWLNTFFLKDAHLIDYLAKAAYLTITPLPFLLYHFVVSYLRKTSEKKHVLKLYALTAVFLGLLFPTNLFIKGSREYSWGYFVDPGPLYPLFLIAALGALLRGLVILKASLATETNLRYRNKTKYLLVGLFLYSFCALDFFQVFGAQWYPLGTFFFIASFLVIAYAVIKHELLDIKIIIRKTIYYSLLALIVSTVYIASIFFLYSIFAGKTESGNYILNSLILILAISLLLKPLEVYLHRYLDKRFFKGSIGEISEQKEKLESELERRERLKSVGVLAAGMAHEIKNPLTAINTFADYLPNKYDDPEFRKKFAKIVKEEVARMKGIVADLLTFSKPAKPVRRKCAIKPILQAILDLLAGDLLKHHIKIERGDVPGEAYIDPDQIKQAFLNIIMNAIEAMKDGGSLGISSRATGESLEIHIKDTGPGIPKDKLKHLFDPFYTDKEEGTGLGLAITHSLVEQNGGKITVESEPGKGTTFVIALPAGR